MRQALTRAGQYLGGFIGFALIIMLPIWQGLEGHHGGWREFIMWSLFILFAYKMGESNGATEAKKKYQREAEEREREFEERLAEQKRFPEQKHREFGLPL